jgi:hypothetical protein
MVTSMASADSRFTNHSGAFCRSAEGADGANVRYRSFGVANMKRSPMDVVCPLSRIPNAANNGGSIFVTVRHEQPVTTTCTAYSYAYDGRLLGSAQQSWTGSGVREFRLDIVGPGKSAIDGEFSVVCNLPAAIIDPYWGTGNVWPTAYVMGVDAWE